MKPTSIIFLAMSLILLFGGFMTCKVAESMAEKQGVKIYSQEKDENGDAVYTYNLSSEEITKLSLVFSNVDVKVHRTEKESYIKLTNFSTSSYSTSLSGNSVSVNGTVSAVSTLIDFSGGGIGFKGLRYLFLDEPDSSRTRSVDLYLSSDSAIKTVDIKSEKGNVILDSLDGKLDFFIDVSGADVILNNLKNTAVVNISATSGNVNVNSSVISSLTVTTESGDITVKSNGLYSENDASYMLKSQEGSVVYNETDKGPSYHTVIPEALCNIKLTSSTGTVYIYDK